MSPRRLLVLASPFPTHVMPLVALCWAWRAAGHEVVVAGRPDLEKVVTSTGLPFAPVGVAFDELRQRAGRPGRPPERGAAPPTPPWDKLGEEWRSRVAADVGPLLAIADVVRPDLILCDPLEFAAPAVAGLIGVPLVMHLWGSDSWPVQVQRPARAQLDGLCRELGLDVTPEPAVVLDPRPPSLATPCWGRPIRAVPFNGVGTVPAWVDRPTRPRRVCVTLGTRHIALNGVSLLESVATACADVPDVEVIVPVAEADRVGLADLPDAVRLVDPCPLTLFLTTCDALVHHGAAGTGMSAFAAGVPQLVLPWAAFDVAHADAVERSGCGLARYADEQGAVSAAVRQVLDDPRFARRASALADEIAAMPSPADVVDSLVRLSAA